MALAANVMATSCNPSRRPTPLASGYRVFGVMTLWGTLIEKSRL